MKISPEELSQPLSDEAPSGEDLEYDPAFVQMETLMQSSGEQEMGDSVIEGSGPDWKGVEEQVKDLLGRTRDLRVFVNAAKVSLHTGGLDGFHNSLAAMNNCMDTLWDSIHPQLDPEDNNDPMMRMNVLQNLTDYQTVRQGLETCELAEKKGIGKVTYRDIELSLRLDSLDEEERKKALTAAQIEGIFSEADPEDLLTLGASVTGSMDELERTQAIWTAKTGDPESLGLEEVAEVLEVLKKTIVAHSPVAAAAVADSDSGGGEESDGAAAAAPAPAVSGAINNRNDVITALERICEYYATHEPSSPVPLLMRRAKNLVAKSFFEILADIAPDSVKKAQALSGGAGGGGEEE
jgi:type VI secretion system protein ImpA